MEQYLENSLGKKGLLAQHIANYEYRKEQLIMSKLVGKSLLQSEHCIIEAGTGVGKSFAYLLPAIKFSLEQEKRLVISTKTINLQEQLLKKDIPLLKNMLPKEFSIVLAKGRRNYLCLKKLEQNAQLMLIESKEQQEINQLHADSIKAKTGDREEFSCNKELWDKLCSDADSCLKKACSHMEKCFFYQAKKKQEKANILLVNHALFFADLALRRNKNYESNSGVLADYQAVIFDEAHHLENIATEFLGIKINYFAFKYLIDHLNMQINSRGPLGEILGFNNKIFEKVQIFLREFNEKALLFFQQGFDYLENQNIKRLKSQEKCFIQDTLTDCLETVIQEIEMIQDAYPLSEEYLALLSNLTNRATSLKSDLQFFLLQQGKEEYVYWIEKQAPKESKLKNITLAAVPISIAEIMTEAVFEQIPSVILTSATLSVNNHFQYFTERIGLKEDCYHSLQLKTPFDYQKQALLYLPKDAPDPRTPQFSPYLIQTIEKLIQLSRGRCFILFTSYKNMLEIYHALERPLHEQGFQLLIQGEQRRDLLLKKFKEDIPSILFGTDSFWEGVDVQGEALSCVIIVKLPFLVPDQPIIQARSEYLEKLNKNPFLTYSLPQAVLKLKQGFGRLIRSKQDQGVIAILDKRITQSFYGKQFLNSLPPAKITNHLAEVKQFLQKEG